MSKEKYPPPTRPDRRLTDARPRPGERPGHEWPTAKGAPGRRSGSI